MNQSPSDVGNNLPPRRRSWFRRILAGLGVVFVAWLIFQMWPVWLVRGPKTTVITGPLRPNGTVDYTAALNEECSAGVTPENNAAVLLIQALGPDIIDPMVRGTYFQLLGIDEPSSDERFLQSLEQMLAGDHETLERVTEEKDQTPYKAPWSATDHPELARWLAVNEAPLKLCAEACRREKYFDPIVPPTGGTMLDRLFPLVQNSRSISRLLGLRVTFHLQAGRIEQALADAETMHRLSRLISQHPLMIPHMTAVALQAMASTADGAIVQSGLVSAEQARQQREMLKILAPFPSMAQIIDHGDRLTTLDIAQVQFIGSKYLGWVQPNALLGTFNAGFDDMVAAMKESELSAQRKAIADVQQQLQSRTKPGWRQVIRIAANPRRGMTTNLADGLMALLSGASEQLAIAERRRKIREELVLAGYALAKYRAVQGKFPQSLDELVPKYVAQIPRDPYTDGPIRYVVDPERGTILLYSIGENGIDDGGRMDGAAKQDDIGFGATSEK